MFLSPRKLNKLSLIIPVYNEAETLPLLIRHLTGFMDDLSRNRPGLVCKVILVDDGSKDASLKLLHDFAQMDERVLILSFSRNFGHQAAVTAGLREAADTLNTEAAVVLDADLQDPLEVIPQMLSRYEEGYDVVYGKRVSRSGESSFKLGTAWLFYRIMRLMVRHDMPTDTGDFRLVSRPVLDAVNSMPEAHRFLRGMFAWAGFAQIAVPYERHNREYGQTKYPLRKMLSLAWRAITSFSSMPMRFVGYFGLIIACFGFLYSLYAIFTYLFGKTVGGWTTLVCLITLIGGSTMLGIGVIGEYIGMIYDEVKQRPVYIIRNRFQKETQISHTGRQK